MAGIDDRKDAFEKKYAHDQELAFKVEARCCKLLGLWAAEQMGIKGDEAAAYAKEVVGANLEEAGFNDVKRKVQKDFAAKNVTVSDHALDRQIEKCLSEAKTQIMEQS
jgi:hypothetical protein